MSRKYFCFVVTYKPVLLSSKNRLDLFFSHLQFKLAEICTKAERYIGTQGGGMDQSISFLAEHGKVMKYSDKRNYQ